MSTTDEDEYVNVRRKGRGASDILDWRDSLDVGATSNILNDLLSGGQEEDDEMARQRRSDVNSIKDTCSSIMTMVKNFNERVDGMPTEARECVLKMNEELSASLVGAIPKNRSSRAPLTSSPASGVNGEERRRVTFSKPPPEGLHTPLASQGASVEHNDTSLASGISSQISTAEVLNALSRLDNRSLPKPEPFDAHTGQSFSGFLMNFEEYCSANFKGNSDFWTGELAGLLTGTMKEVFEAYRVPGMGYYQLKDKLLHWYGIRTEGIEKETKARFRQATMRPAESLSIYAARLEKLFKLAFPRKDVENSRTLRDKFINTVPEPFKTQLTAARSMRRAFDFTDLTWSSILTFTCHCEEFSKSPSPVAPVSDAVYVVSDPVRDLPQGNRAPQMQERGNARDTRSYNRQGASARSRSATERDNRGLDQTRADGACFYCGNKGHIKRECHRFLKQCFACGSDDHRIANCPIRRLGPGAKEDTGDPEN